MGEKWGRIWKFKDTIKIKCYIVKVMKWEVEMNGNCD